MNLGHNKDKEAQFKVKDPQDICGQKCLKRRYESLADKISDLEKLNRQVLLVHRICKAQPLVECVQNFAPNKSK